MRRIVKALKGGTRIFGILCLVISTASSQALADFSLKDLPVKIQSKTEFYNIQKIGKSSESGILKFQVWSAHGVYEVEGLLPLVKILHEIEVIERIKRNEQGNGFFEGAAASVEATGTGLKNLVVHPVDSAKGIGKAVGKLGRGVGGMFRSKESGEKSSFGEKMLGGNERELAKEFGVDVYTTNPYLKEMIRSMAKSRMGGKGAVAVIKFLIPIAAVASIALTAGSLNDAADQLVNDSSRAELYRLNKEAMIAMGIGEKEVLRFLNMTVLTPREQTYLRFYLEKLKYAPGFHEILYSMFDPKSDWQVRKKLYEAQIAANADRGQIVKINSFPEGIALQEKEGRILLITAQDDLQLQGSGEYFLGQAQNMTAQTGFPVEIINGGKIENDFLNAARQNRVKTKAWVYLLGDKASEAI